MTPEGNDAAGVLELFDRQARHRRGVLRQPPLPLVHPGRTTKASLLFDMFVSCSSLQGTSWLEAAGVVVAENQALGVLADAGGPPGRCRRLLRGRRLRRQPVGPHGGPRHGRPPRHAEAPLRPLVAISEDAHSSVGKALHVLGVGAL